MLHHGLGKEIAMTETTGYTLDQFLADTRATIKTKGVPSGLAEIRDHLEKLLRNPELLKKHLGDPVPYRERTTIGHDPETDVHVLVHGREKGGKSVPHDHGPCWVIYGNYKNPTRMRRWRRLDDGSKPGHAELELQRDFMNEAGHAAVFAVGDIHSIEYGDDTFFIRVTGGDVESQKTLRFDLDKKSVQVAERAEDIPPAAMEAGIEWRWTTFPEFLDCLDSLPKGINYGGYVGHSAVRTYVMGERAFEQAASEDDLKAMEREVRDAIRAGAIGFTTSRSPAHETPDGRYVASRLATWNEVRRLVGV